MSMALLVIGIVFLIAAVRGEHKKFFELLKSDFTGPGNFIFWALSLWIIIAVGYYKPLKAISNSFLVLVLLMMLLSNQSFFTKFVNELNSR